ncbi:hypothetical protein [uncultured Dokdonia sp.]|uniref:hypothetical protein n=1 Tax=uncultured Dokdonia sp. TaxID=575653 RepID=UPI002609EAD4|nr:hypothetical protein [uncultured Dokdonia sp.]
MKKILITFLILFASITTVVSQNSNILKLRTTELAIKYLESNSWGDWSDWKDTNVLVVFDLDKDRIRIFSKETQVYDVIEDEGQSYDDDGDEIYSYLCVNEDGSRCRVELWKRYRTNGSSYNQLYIKFSDMRWVYNLDVID